MKTAKPVLLLGFLLGALVSTTANAALIGIDPVFQSANIGDTVSVDIVVSDLAADESVGGVSLFLSFDDSILRGEDFTLDPLNVMGNEDDFFSGFAGGDGSPLELIFLADFLLDHAALQALQGDSFVAATVLFTAIGDGLSLLNLSVAPTDGIFLSDAEGSEIGTQAVNGSVCVGDPAGCVTTVPEPETMALLGLGFALIAIRGCRRRRLA